jgi:hypothetical protein
MRASSVTHRDVSELHATLKATPYRANRVLALPHKYGFELIPIAGDELALKVGHSLARRNPVPREEFIQPALVNTCQRVQPMNAGNYLLHFDVVQSTGRDDEGWVAKLPCQTQTGGVDIPESEFEAQAMSAETLPRFW